LLARKDWRGGLDGGNGKATFAQNRIERVEVFERHMSQSKGCAWVHD